LIANIGFPSPIRFTYHEIECCSKIHGFWWFLLLYFRWKFLPVSEYFIDGDTILSITNTEYCFNQQAALTPLKTFLHMGFENISNNHEHTAFPWQLFHRFLMMSSYSSWVWRAFMGGQKILQIYLTKWLEF
jgi:hypothetical protein